LSECGWPIKSVDDEWEPSRSTSIQLRVNELISGVRSDVGVKIFGDDLDMLVKLADQVQAVLQTIPGAADVRTEPVQGLPVLTVTINRAALARYGISVAEIQALVEAAVGGKNAGPGAAITLTLKTAGGKTGQARFKR
jgi:Cu/Ag efflux pump CusA